MSIHVAVEHRTTYRYDRPVRVAPHVVRLRPAPHCRTPIEAYSLHVTPTEHFCNWQQDPFGNHLARFVFPEPTRELSFTVDLVADMTIINPFDFFIDEEAAHWPFAYDEALARDLQPYRTPGGGGPLVDDWLRQVEVPHDGDEAPAIVDFLVGLNRRVHADVAYSVRMEPGVQAPEETLAKAVGSCRDSAWLLVDLLRRLGLAARFVSGYLVQLTADLAALDGPSGPSADFTDLHAWTEVYLPGAGWVGLDPTSGLFAGEGHIPLACTPEPTSAAPITGVTEPAEVEFEFSNVVRRFREDPRVTKPFTDEQWRDLVALGRAVDAELSAGDVRLTMGGEPTFVSIDDMEADEWTTAADGPHKREAAGVLAWRLLDDGPPGGVVQHGQGKWYPGEPLPRWQLGIHRRTDGVPLWRQRPLLADPAVAVDGPTAASTHDAARFATELAAVLGVADGTVFAAFEDDAHAAWLASTLPPEVEAPEVPTDPVAWVLPVHWDDRRRRWSTSTWRFRRGRCVLVPGDSPAGLRLPLSSLPEIEERPAVGERSPFEPRDELGPHPLEDPAPPPGAKGDDPEERDDADAEDADVPPTAVVLQPVDGHLRAFLPPTRDLEHFVSLLNAVEATAAASGRPVVLEGYPPPSDHRLRTVSLAPDPGVLEVNVAPSTSWDELVTTTTALYEHARQARLGTETFDLDGHHTGTGGGNHLTLGGPTPADSPLLRRPDLLRSLVTYWQHHPSLSYLFSGRFIGPTSQAPRVDEARHEALYELEHAFAQIDGLAAEPPRTPERADTDATAPDDDDLPPPGDTPPWLVDRLLRHLLVDLTGNTHRAEFCIDKLFSPDSERGRLGLVELRGFEMPPHPRMALLQALLVRTLVAWFWREPYRRPLRRWGTELHDRFLLPFGVERDLRDVLDDLHRAGHAVDPAWFAPFVEFRFPRLGTVEIGPARLSLRAAIEPWYTLGEETAAAATARYVDSSVERLQVLVEGLDADRYAVTCNGVPVPLHPTGTVGTAVAGVRYRAWQPPTSLHPTIGVHAPLVFDLVDRWNRRSLGGCTYHVSHPGGRSYDTFPVNANEAEARRNSRFWDHGHTPGPVGAEAIAPPVEDPEYPWTLDRRRHPGAQRHRGRRG
ncbi:MAG: transglutaminase family protein [Acidimicrobiales bacterium]